MLSYTQAIVLGLLQGITELFPISSLGHSVLIPALLHWQINQSSDQFVSFVVLTHLATVLVLLVFFWRDWVRIIFGMVHSLLVRNLSNKYARLGWLLVVSTVPAGLLGLLLQQKVQDLFSDAPLVAMVLILNGVVLYGADHLRRQASGEALNEKNLSALSWWQAVYIGLFECFALIPGFSRTGFTMTGGLLSGLDMEDAARYSFLLATPVIFAASVLKVPDLFVNGHAGLLPALLGAVSAALAAYVSVRFLVKYFRTKSLKPFALYCVLAGVLSLLILLA
jgi:undecaprenyl-diphosphatase